MLEVRGRGTKHYAVLVAVTTSLICRVVVLFPTHDKLAGTPDYEPRGVTCCDELPAKDQRTSEIAARW